jgi:predicted O-methyltransferase YrrM
VANGFSSAFILHALEKNGKGKLYSIDLPNQEGQEIKGGKLPGWLVEEGLRKRWELIFGDSKIELPKLCARLKDVDIFYHDSDHSYESMIFEFNTAFKCVRQKGLIVSDDITDNRAFSDFCKRTSCKNTELFKLGISKKELQD